MSQKIIDQYKFARHLKYVGVLAVLFVLPACQTTNIAEEQLVLAPGIFQPEDVRRSSKNGPHLSQIQTILAKTKGRFTSIEYTNGGSTMVFSDGKTLSIFELKRWKFFKDVKIMRGTEEKINTPLGAIPFQRFSAKGYQCIFFRYVFQPNLSDDQGRFSRSLMGIFCEVKGLNLKDTVISEYLHQVGITSHYDSRPTAASVEPQVVAGAVDNYETAVNNDTSSQKEVTSLKSYKLYGVWDGVSENIKGTFSTDRTKGKGKLQVLLIQGDKPCVGQWIYVKGEYNTPNPPQGTWSFACSNGKAASGTYKSFKIGEGIIEGLDNIGKKINMYFN